MRLIPTRAGDQSFWGPGIPSLYMLLSNLPKDQWAAVGGCGMNWWWHTESDTVETAEEVADTIERALQFVPRERLIACTNCGLAPMSRAVAEAKLRALADGAALARARLGGA